MASRTRVIRSPEKAKSASSARFSRVQSSPTRELEIFGSFAGDRARSRATIVRSEPMQHSPRAHAPAQVFAARAYGPEGRQRGKSGQFACGCRQCHRGAAAQSFEANRTDDAQ